MPADLEVADGRLGIVMLWRSWAEGAEVHGNVRNRWERRMTIGEVLGDYEEVRCYSDWRAPGGVSCSLLHPIVAQPWESSLCSFEGGRGRAIASHLDQRPLFQDIGKYTDADVDWKRDRSSHNDSE